MEVPTKWALSAVALAVIGGAVWLSGKVYQPATGVKLADSDANLSLMSAGKGSEPSSNGQAATGPANMASASRVTRSPDEIRDVLFATPAFKGAPVDGDCLIDSAGQLKPDIELRRRFDFFLRDQSEVTIPEIRSLLAVDGCPGKSPAVVAQMLDVWDKYWRLKNHAYEHVASAQNPFTWMAAFNEHKTVRRQVMGAAWGDAFFGDEEATFQKVVDAMLGKSSH